MSYGNVIRVFESLASLFGGWQHSKNHLPVLVPGTHVYLQAPPGFIEAPNFCGFINPASEAFIMINEIPAPVAEISRGFDAVALASKGLTLLSKDSVEVSGSVGTLMLLRQKRLGGFLNKWVAAFGNSHQTVLITASFPEDDIAIGDELKNSILEVLWDPSVAADPLANLSFIVEPPAGMKLAQRQHMMLLYTSDGALGHSSPRDPLLIIGQSVGNAETCDLPSFARRRLLQTEGCFDFEIRRERELTIDRLSAYEIDADAKDNRQFESIAIYQVIILPPGANTYFIAQGLIHSELARFYVPSFERCVLSFKLR